MFATLRSFSRTQLIIGGVLLALSLTPLYMLSFLVVLALAARWRPKDSVFFATYFTRLVAAFLLLGATIMIVGAYCYLADIALLPVYVLLVVAVIAYAVQRFVPGVFGGGKLLSKSDVLAGGAALIGAVIMHLSFFGAVPNMGAVTQIFTNGFDNGAHLSLIQTTYEGKGYVFGTYEEIQDKIGWKTLTAYPQGWHLANAFYWDGFGVDVFKGDSRGLAFYMYSLTVLLWQTIAIFLMGKAALFLARQLGVTYGKRQLGMGVAFVAANLLFQLLVFWGSHYFGFASFLGAVAYMLLLSALLLEVQVLPKKYGPAYFVTAGMIVSAIALVWLLPVVVAGGMALLSIGLWANKQAIKDFMGTRKQQVTYEIIAAVLVVPVGMMVMVNRLYSTQGGSQINDHGGIFGISSMLVGLLLIFAAVTYLRRQSWLQGGFLMIVGPQLLFAGLIYMYQFLTIGHTEYFFTKSIALLLCLLSIFVIAAWLKVMSQLKFTAWTNLYLVAISLVAATGVVMCTGQDVANAKALVQRGSKMRYETATKLGDTIKSGELMQRNVIVFTQLDFGGDVNGNVLTTALNTKKTECVGNAIWSITDHRGKDFPRLLDECVRQDGSNITVIVSSDTEKLLTDLNNPNIRIARAY